MTEPKETWFCSVCGSLNIVHDATARWDPDTEEFELIDVCDGDYCEDCERQKTGMFAIPNEPDEAEDDDE